MIPLVLVDTGGRELGRCSIESGVTFKSGHSVDLGPVGYFRILGVHHGESFVLVAEPAERPRWPYELVIRKDGIEHRHAFLDAECSYSLGDRLRWPPERGQTPVEHQVVAIRPTTDNHRTALVIERMA